MSRNSDEVRPISYLTEKVVVLYQYS